MTLPVVPLTKPTAIAGLTADKIIGPCFLTPVFFPGVGWSSLNPFAARAWAGLSIAATAAKEIAGTVLTVTSVVDAHRPYSVQLAAFQARYTPTYSPLVNVVEHQRVWTGHRYWLRRTKPDGRSPGMIPCAAPGTGPHPLGLAVDVAICDPHRNDGDAFPGDPISIRSNPKVWTWLKANVVSLGWSWEYPTEGTDDPHLRYYAGDELPQRVLDIEAWINHHT